MSLLFFIIVIAAYFANRYRKRKKKYLFKSKVNKNLDTELTNRKPHEVADDSDDEKKEPELMVSSPSN